jgi:hypothetical protein
VKEEYPACIEKGGRLTGLVTFCVGTAFCKMGLNERQVKG